MEIEKIRKYENRKIQILREVKIERKTVQG